MNGGNINKKLISVIIPVYNEEQNVDRAYQAIINEFKKIKSVEYEIIFTDNHSTDGTFEKLSYLANQDDRVRVLRFARNFGFQRSILTGYQHAQGQAAIQIDCDLEDPPSVFPEFIRLWQAGHDVVVGIRTQRVEKPYMATLRHCYYWLLMKISDVSDVPHEANGGDFRLVSRDILNQLQSVIDMQPYVRGLISELAKNQTNVQYARQKREFGQSKFPLKQLLKMALEGIFAYSTKPLRMATYCGIFIAFLTTIMLSAYIILRIFFAHTWPAGFTTTTVLLLFGISLNGLFLGIIGEYIGRIYNQIRQRPAIVIEKTINIDMNNTSTFNSKYPQVIIKQHANSFFENRL